MPRNKNLNNRIRRRSDIENPEDAETNISSYVNQEQETKSYGMLDVAGILPLTILTAYDMLPFFLMLAIILAVAAYLIYSHRLKFRSYLEAEKIFRTLFEESDDFIVFHTNLDGKIVHCSKSGLKLMGCKSVKEAKRVTLKALYKDLGQRKSYIDKLKTDGKVSNYQIIGKDSIGQEIVLSLNSRLLRSKNGEPKGIIGIARNITDRVVAFRELSKSEAKYRELVDFLPQPLFEIDLDGNTLFVNKSGRSLLGYSENEEGAPVNLKDIMSESEAKKAFDVIHKKAMEIEPQLKANEYSLIKKDRSTVPVMIYSSLIKKNNQPVGLRGIIVDITDRKKIEQALRESESLYRTLVETAQDAIFSIDRDGRYLFINKYGAAQLNLTPNELTGKTLWDIFPKEIADRHYQVIKGVIESTKGVNNETETIIQGKSQWYRMHIQPLICENKECNSVLAIAANITNIKETNRLLESQQKDLQRLSSILINLQESERQAVARELHDSVAQSLTLAKLKVESAILEHENNGHHQTLVDASYLISNAADDLRHISSNLWPKILDNKTLDKAFRWYLDNLCPKNIKFDIQTAGKTRHLPHIKKANLFRVFQEIILNVIKHAKASQVKISIDYNSGQQIILKFEDNGKGFNNEDINNRINSKNGFGLLNIKERINMLNGKINIDSKPGRGTSLQIEIPVDEAINEKTQDSPGR